MWVKALDLLLTRMRDLGFPFPRVAAVAVSGQQHGSVYWSKGAEARLAALDPALTLYDQLREGAFTFAESPIWMDSSTGAECVEMEAAVRKATSTSSSLASITGAKAYERFTGPQLRKKWKLHRSKMLATEAVSLVSSFGASLLLGRVAPIDASDAAGTNLADFRTKTWSPVCLDACCASSA